MRQRFSLIIATLASATTASIPFNIPFVIMRLSLPPHFMIPRGF